MVSTPPLLLPVLQIILLQAEIDELSKTAKLDMDFEKIKGGFLLNVGFIYQQLRK